MERQIELRQMEREGEREGRWREGERGKADREREGRWRLQDFNEKSVLTWTCCVVCINQIPGLTTTANHLYRRGAHSAHNRVGRFFNPDLLTGALDKYVVQKYVYAFFFDPKTLFYIIF